MKQDWEEMHGLIFFVCYSCYCVNSCFLAENKGYKESLRFVSQEVIQETKESCFYRLECFCQQLCFVKNK